MDLPGLIATHERLVYAMCARLTEDPEDAAQEVWEKVTRAASRFDSERATSVRSWIATITRRTLVDRHRRRQVRGSKVSPDVLVERRTPESLLELSTRRSRLETAVHALPVDQRHVIVMHHIHGVPLATLAAELEVPLGTVKSRLHRGRAQLARTLRSA